MREKCKALPSTGLAAASAVASIYKIAAATAIPSSMSSDNSDLFSLSGLINLTFCSESEAHGCQEDPNITFSLMDDVSLGPDLA